MRNLLQRYTHEWHWPWQATPALDAVQIAALLAQAQLSAAELECACRQIRQCQQAALLLPLAAHKNGYLRAAVLQRLQISPAAANVSAIVARLNDWVPEVRLHARIALRAHFTAACFAALLQAWPQVRHLYHCERAIHRHLVMEVEQFLLSRKFHAQLIAALHAPQRELARECFRLVAHAQLLPMAELITLALASRDRLVAGCAPAWMTQLPLPQRILLLQRGLHAAHRQVRYACGVQLARLRED